MRIVLIVVAVSLGDTQSQTYSEHAVNTKHFIGEYKFKKPESGKWGLKQRKREKKNMREGVHC